MNWDSYWFKMADAAKEKCQCFSRKIGAVLVTEDNTLISSGYNGPPREMKTCDQRIITLDDGTEFDCRKHPGKCPRYV